MIVQPQFFEAASQLIPVLLIAAAVDARGWASEAPHSPRQALSEIWALLALTVAWTASLLAVATGSTSAVLLQIVFFALALGWTQIVSTIAFRQIHRIRRARVRLGLRLLAAATAILPLVAAVGVGLVVAN